MMMGHHPGKRVVLTEIRLLEAKRLLVVLGNQIQAKISPLPDGFSRGRQTALKYLEIW